MFIGLDVAVAVFRAVGRDAQDDDGAAGSFVNGLLHGLSEGGGIGLGLVGRGDHQHRVLAGGLGGQGRQREGRCSVAARGLQQGMAQRNARLTQLLRR